MEYKWIYLTGGTELVKNALPFMAVFALSLVPNNNHIIPQQSPVSYGEYSKVTTQSVASSSVQINESEQSKTLLSFATRLVENTKDLDNDIAQIISNDFWEMYD